MQIWETADRENLGYLTPETFSIALKLIACAQHGQDAVDPILATSVPLPQFEGIRLDASSPVMQRNTMADTIKPAEREKYIAIFRANNPVNGVIEGDAARNILLKSKLPAKTLGDIWNLADVRKSGNLNQTEFIIAMHYVAKLMERSLTTLPPQLPPHVYAAAAGNVQSPVLRQMSTDRLVASPIQSFAATPRQMNNMVATPPQRAQAIDSLGNMAFSSAATAKEPRQWDVTAQEKAQYDVFFDKIDMRRVGFIQGREAVEFFKNSRLPDADLAQVWDLADTQQCGRLTRDEFAVAMHLIHKRLRGEPLPQTLSSTLIPPSPRVPFMGSPAAGPAILQREPTVAQSPSTHRANDVDLLGDFGNNEQLTKETNEVNQLHNQIASLKQATLDIKEQKVTVEQSLEQLARQKEELQAQTVQARMAHEAESKALVELQEVLRAEEPIWNQLRLEHEAAQQQLTETQNEITQLKQTLEEGRLESERSRRRVHEIQEETAQLTAELERLRAQVKQQDMMVNINRRQVTASEQDREQAKRDLADFKVEQNLDVKETDETETTSPQEEKTSSSPFDMVFSPAAAPAALPKVDSGSPFDAFRNLKSSDDGTESPFDVAFETPSETPVPESSPSFAFDDIFSPRMTEAEANAIQDKKKDESLSDFDAVFGDLAAAKPEEEEPPKEPIETINNEPLGSPDAAKASTMSAGSNNGSNGAPVRSARVAPPPPPPQSRHHRSASETQGNSTLATKKPRAPPPPRSVLKEEEKNEEKKDVIDEAPSIPPTEETNKPSEEDEFDAEFASGPLTEAKVVTDGFADFDAVFDDPKREIKPSSTTWPNQFSGFDFPPSASAKGEDEWDSIFGGSTTATKEGDSKQTEKTEPVGFEDAFSSFISGEAAPAAATVQGNEKTSKGPSEEKGTEEKIDELVKMGFDAQAAKEALERYDKDLEKATNFLLDQSSK
ncbi:hypothetical protein EC973_006119 [Apophysomyces ossiformis]|uniref:Uncharacterized protein n=1 Tax=Apophysomyces ossiformis TaxID=679940 RepID=A0A8H7EUN1_9FUNG|nr:hypothetical protein EC973_006119 [Apophysomyces ossiformis]